MMNRKTGLNFSRLSGFGTLVLIAALAILAGASEMQRPERATKTEKDMVDVNSRNTKSETISAGENLVSFRSGDHQLAGLLFTPDGFDNKEQYPTVVFSGPVLQVKEMMGAVYGKEFAKKGYVFLSFDHIGHGESEGDVAHENGDLKKETIRDAISYLCTLGFVDKDRLFAIGGCASAAYVPLVAVTDKRIKALATISGRSSNITTYFEDGSKDDFLAQVTAANEARQRAYESGEVQTFDTFAVYRNASREDFPEGLLRDGYDYYMTDRGGAENFTSVADATVMEYVPLLDSATFAPYFFMPYIGVVGENAQTRHTTEKLYERAEEPKELVVIEGASHVSLYDDPEQVEQVVDRIHAFWAANVK